MISIHIALVVLEYVTIVISILGFFAGIVAGEMSYKQGMKNTFYYAMALMGVVYIYLNHRYMQGAQIAAEVSIMYRMYHLSGAIITFGVCISRIIECWKLVKP